MSPPIITPYKKRFIVKRVCSTFTGGPKFVPSLSLVVIQFVLYIIPAVILCVVNVLQIEDLSWKWKGILTGVGIFLTDVTLSFLIWIVKQRKDSNVNPEEIENGRDNSPDTSNTTAALFDEEETLPTDGCLKSSTWRFIASNVDMSLCHFFAIFASALSALLCAAILADQTVHPLLKGFVCFTICNARYSSVINSPPEVSTFDPVNRRHLFYRPFYVSVCASIHFVNLIVMDINSNSGSEIHGEIHLLPKSDSLTLTTEFPGYSDFGGFSPDTDTRGIPVSPPSPTTCSTQFAILLSVLPVIWITGILPPLDALFPWLFETLLAGYGGKSIGYTYLGTTVSLAFAVVGPVVTFILSQELKVTFLLECLCGYLISCDTGSMPKLKASLCEDVPAKYFLQQLTKPAVTILCSLLTIFAVETTISHVNDVPDREIYFPIFAAFSIFIVFTTKLVQAFDVSKKRTYRAQILLSIFSMWYGLLTVLLHVWFTLELITIHLETSLTKSWDTVVHSLQQLLPCILTIRFFGLAVTEPHNSTVNMLLAYIALGFIVPPDYRRHFVFILFIVSILHDIFRRFLSHLRMMVVVTYSTFTSTLLDRKYVAGAALLSAPVSFLSVLVASVIRGMNLVPMFTLPIFTLAFPRPQTFWKGLWFTRGCGHNETQKIMPVASSVDWTLYADTAPFLVLAFAKRSDETKTELRPGACFIARYEDRLMFIRIISSGWKFLYAQVKGLEIQEQTSCHHQEAAWMDEMFEKYFNSCSSFWKRFCMYPKMLVNSLQPTFCLNVPSYSESKSQLPSFLSKSGKMIFRDMFFRAFSYLWIKGNPAFQGELYRRPIASGVPLSKASSRVPSQASTIRNGSFSTQAQSNGSERNSFQLGSVAGHDMNGNRGVKVDSEEDSSNLSLRGASAPMRHHPQLRDVSATNWQGSVSYPLIPGLPNMTVEESDVESLPGGGTVCYTHENESGMDIGTPRVSPPSVLTRRNCTSWDGLPQFWMKQCVGDAIPHNAVKARVEKLCWKAWEVAFGTHDDLYEVDMARFYRREFARNMRTALIHEKPDVEEMAVRAFRYATKLTLDEVYASGIDIDGPFMSGLSSASNRSADLTENLSQFSRSEEDEQAVFLQLTSFEKSHRFCPYDEIPYWMSDKAKHIVSISSDADKNVLRMFNYQSEGVEFAVGQLSRFCVEGIWASLNTELLYLTSDDDERYSIQHNKYLLRNICAQSAQTLGYPVYEATYRVNLFDFSLEQVTS